jgi:hypothetical protein
MLFEELVKQHRVHHFVAHGAQLAITASRDQIGAYPLDILGN